MGNTGGGTSVPDPVLEDAPFNSLTAATFDNASPGVALPAAATHGLPRDACRFAFDATQRLLAVGTTRGRVKVIGGGKDAPVQAWLHDPEAHHSPDWASAALHLEFIPSHGLLVEVHQSSGIRVWDLTVLASAAPETVGGEENAPPSAVVARVEAAWTMERVTAVAHPPASRFPYVYVATADGTIQVLDAVTGRFHSKTIEPRDIGAKAPRSERRRGGSSAGVDADAESDDIVAILPDPSDENRIVIAYETLGVFHFDVQKCRTVNAMQAPRLTAEFGGLDEDDEGDEDDGQADNTVTCVAVHASGKHIVAGYSTGNLCLWDVGAKSGIGAWLPIVSDTGGPAPYPRSPIENLHWCRSPSTPAGPGALLFTGGQWRMASAAEASIHATTILYLQPASAAAAGDVSSAWDPSAARSLSVPSPDGENIMYAAASYDTPSPPWGTPAPEFPSCALLCTGNPMAGKAPVGFVQPLSVSAAASAGGVAGRDWPGPVLASPEALAPAQALFPWDAGVVSPELLRSTAGVSCMWHSAAVHSSVVAALAATREQVVSAAAAWQWPTAGGVLLARARGPSGSSGSDGSASGGVSSVLWLGHGDGRITVFETPTAGLNAMYLGADGASAKNDAPLRFLCSLSLSQLAALSGAHEGAAHLVGAGGADDGHVGVSRLRFDVQHDRLIVGTSAGGVVVADLSRRQDAPPPAATTGDGRAEGAIDVGDVTLGGLGGDGDGDGGGSGDGEVSWKVVCCVRPHEAAVTRLDADGTGFVAASLARDGTLALTQIVTGTATPVPPPASLAGATFTGLLVGSGLQAPPPPPKGSRQPADAPPPMALPTEAVFAGCSNGVVCAFHAHTGQLLATYLVRPADAKDSWKPEPPGGRVSLVCLLDAESRPLLPLDAVDAAVRSPIALAAGAAAAATATATAGAGAGAVPVTPRTGVSAEAAAAGNAAVAVAVAAAKQARRVSGAAPGADAAPAPPAAGDSTAPVVATEARADAAPASDTAGAGSGDAGGAITGGGGGGGGGSGRGAGVDGVPPVDAALAAGIGRMLLIVRSGHVYVVPVSFPNQSALASGDVTVSTAGMVTAPVSHRLRSAALTSIDGNSCLHTLEPDGSITTRAVPNVDVELWSRESHVDDGTDHSSDVFTFTRSGVFVRFTPPGELALVHTLDAADVAGAPYAYLCAVAPMPAIPELPLRQIPAGAVEAATSAGVPQSPTARARASSDGSEAGSGSGDGGGSGGKSKRKWSLFGGGGSVPVPFTPEGCFGKLDTPGAGAGGGGDGGGPTAREELLGVAEGDEDDSDAEGVGGGRAGAGGVDTGGTLEALGDAVDAVKLRGEKIARTQDAAEELKDKAKDFADSMTELRKANEKRKKSMFGLF